ncbi:MAG: hypothetical protein KAH86_01360 [Methanosarcinales archaeon]|nr:hypothetical protein [Methanosarcinales archaeon]
MNKKLASILIIALLAFSLVASGCVGNDKKAVEETAEELNLPSYAYGNPLVLKAYTYTTQYPELIDLYPCYCGCYEHSGHESLKNCYITQDGQFTDHAAYCDICVGEVIMIKKLYDDGVPLQEIREKVDKEYRKYSPPTPTPPIPEGFVLDLDSPIAPTTNSQTTPPMQPVQAAIDLFGLELTDNFDSLTDGINRTPSGIIWARFVNVKETDGTVLAAFAQQRVQPLGFYGIPVIGMYAADYTSTLWIELHDVGKAANVNAINEPGMANIVTSRPFIYGHTSAVNRVITMIADPQNNANAYSEYSVVLDKVDDENAGVADITKDVTGFSDISYDGYRAVGGSVERVVAYHLTGDVPQKYADAAATAESRGFIKYDVEHDDDVLIITMVSDFDTVLAEDV